MKMVKLSSFFSFLLVAAVMTTANAQYDDVYFDPDRDVSYTSSKGARYTKAANDNATNTSNYNYDDSAYDFGRESSVNVADEQHDYYYTSRIRRFNRPYYGFNFYDPVYVDMAYYDPFVAPGATVLIYDNFNSFSAFNSWNRWNRWSRVNRFATWGGNPYTPYYSSWGGNRWNNGFNSWDPWYGSSFANNYSVNNFYGVGGGFVSNYYCPPSWGGGYTYNTVNTINNNNSNTNGTYSGPRNTGVTPNPRDNSNSPRTRFLEAPREANTTVQGVRSNPASRVTTPAGNQPARTVTPAPTERTRTYEQPRPTRETTPARSYEQPRNTAPATTPARTPVREATPAPRRDNTPTRSYDTPSRSTTPSRSYDTPSRSYDSPSRSTTPSRSYDSPSRSTMPSSSPSRSSSPSSTPSRTRGN